MPIELPSEKFVLFASIPARLQSKIARVDMAERDYQIVVTFRNGHELSFEINEWLTDACIARIALECP